MNGSARPEVDVILVMVQEGYALIVSIYIDVTVGEMSLGTGASLYTR